MRTSLDELRTLDDLRNLIHKTLCERENLLADQFRMTEMQLVRSGRVCGLQFSLCGPRNLRLGAVWAADHNVVYFYDAQGNRYLKQRLPNRITDKSQREAAGQSEANLAAIGKFAAFHDES